MITVGTGNDGRLLVNASKSFAILNKDGRITSIPVPVYTFTYLERLKKKKCVLRGAPREGTRLQFQQSCKFCSSCLSAVALQTRQSSNIAVTKTKSVFDNPPFGDGGSKTFSFAVFVIFAVKKSSREMLRRNRRACHCQTG
jgi:hypothetical protein